MSSAQANGHANGAANGVEKPKLEDLSAENLTDHVIKISSNISNERVKYIFSKLIKHAHDFVREVDLQKDEWETTVNFLAAVCCLQSFECALLKNRYDVYIYSSYEIDRVARSVKLVRPIARKSSSSLTFSVSRLSLTQSTRVKPPGRQNRPC